MSASGPISCIPLQVAKRFIKECIVSAGATASHATDMADALVTADHRGHFSHGLNRLEMYVKDLQTGIVQVEGEPQVEKETAATAMVDGRNLMGPVVGKFCMNLAIKKAKESGVGWVVARQSNHYSIAGHYALMASKEGLIGMSMTNTSPLVMGTRAKQCTLGTNPIAFGAPANSGDSFVLDMATSTAAIGKVELQKRSNEATLGTNPICCAAPGVGEDEFVLDMATTTVAYGKVEVADRKGETIPNGWGADKHGKETNTPSEVLEGGGLLPLGGNEMSGGYKGYGLAMMVEVLCGISAGATYGPNIRKWGSTARTADLGQCFIAVDPNAFCPGFEGRLQDLMDTQRNLNPVDSDKPVLVAGDPERERIKACDDLGGIPYPRNVVDYMNEVGRKLNVDCMEEIIPKKS